MANFVYVLADSATRKAWVVDPAWAPLGIVKIAGEQGYEVTGVLATHFHQDHIGGEIMGQYIPGVRELRAEFDLPMLIHEAEAERGAEIAGCPPDRVEAFRDGDVLELGDLRVEVLHTPGHSPGSCCFRAGDHMLTADTLFVQGIGRSRSAAQRRRRHVPLSGAVEGAAAGGGNLPGARLRSGVVLDDRP